MGLLLLSLNVFSLSVTQYDWCNMTNAYIISKAHIQVLVKHNQKFVRPVEPKLFPWYLYTKHSSINSTI